MPPLVLLALLLPILLALFSAMGFRKNEKRDNSKLPQGNMGWPLIGETLSFLKPYPATSIGDFMQQRMSRFGKIFRSNLFGQPTVVSADAELNRFMLQNDLRLFEPNCPTSMSKIIGKYSLILLVGDAHKRMRSVILNFLSNARLRTLFLRDAERLAIMFLSSWKEKDMIYVSDEAKKFTFNMIGKNILSMEPEKLETEKLQREYKTFMRGFVSFPLNLPGTSYHKALKSRSNIVNFIKQKMEERINKTKDGNGEIEEDDLLTWVLENSKYSTEEICDLLLGMLFAGHETISTAITLVIYFLEGCPKALDQLQEEHVEIVKRKNEKEESGLNWDDYKQLKFTQCVINETLRLGNVAKYVQRKTKTYIQFKGYDIPCGLNFMAVFSAVHLDPSIFEDPRHFNPWRWQSFSGIKKTNNFMAFGGGVRLCPGEELARMEIAVFLHHLILNYKWELTEPNHPCTYPFVDFPKVLRIKVQPLQID